MVLYDFENSKPMALAAYNAGPKRSRHWRDGPKLEPAIWTELVPFFETRLYIKKVLANTAMYAARLTGKPQSLKTLLGQPIGPRAATAKAPDQTLP